DIIEEGEKHLNNTIGILVFVALVMLTIFYMILFGGKKAVVYNTLSWRLIFEFASVELLMKVCCRST
ncbi:hypothetical protein MKW92_039375, partial [Papaver armeniacum]